MSLKGVRDLVSGNPQFRQACFLTSPIDGGESSSKAGEGQIQYRLVPCFCYMHVSAECRISSKSSGA
jgi:hypothetical protein